MKSIIKEKKLGKTNAKVAEQFNVSESTILQIVTRKTWRHVEVD